MRWQVLLLELSFVNAVEGAPLRCYQPMYQEFCCVDGDATLLSQGHPHCNVFGHQSIQRSPYLRKTANSTANDAQYQEAFLKQGIFNTNTLADLKSTWLGVTIRQPPQDMMIFQQLIFVLRPKLFIETGTFRGGMAYYVSSIFHLMQERDARVITIDRTPKEDYEMKADPPSALGVGALGINQLWRRYVHEVVASSLSDVATSIVHEHVRRLHPGAPVIVSLDARHDAAFVWEEIWNYAPFVSIGSFLVVQDVILSFAKYGWQGPYTAVMKLLKASGGARQHLGSFVWDRSVEHFGYTGHAYLRRVA